MASLERIQLQKKYSDWSLTSKKSSAGKVSRARFSSVTTQPYSTHHKYVHRTSYKHKFQKSSSESGEIGIPGVQKLFNPEYSKQRKAFWFLALVGCAMICVYQLQDRLIFYFQRHVAIDITSKNVHGANFPAVTVCPAKQPFRNTSKYLILMNERCSSSSEAKCNHANFTFEEMNTSLDEIWSEVGITEAAIHVYTSCVVLKSSNCDADGDVPVSMTKKKLDTFWGPCMIMYPEESLDYRGPSYTYLDIKFNTSLLFDEEYSSRMALVQIYFHPTNIVQRHEAYLYAEYVYKSYFTTIRVRGKEYYYKFRPCEDNIKVTECRNQCFDKILDTRVSCKLPFMKSSRLASCKTFSDALKAYNEAEINYREMNLSKCSCPKKCNNLVYASESDVEGRVDTNETLLSIYKTDDMNEIITETTAYNFPSLLSDIGGTLGFFLGICMLNLLELIETIVKNMPNCNICCRRVKRRQSPKMILAKSQKCKSPWNPISYSEDSSHGIIIKSRSKMLSAVPLSKNEE